MRQINQLAGPVTTHLHGGDVPAGEDGHPLDLIAPGASGDYFYPGLHPAANLWYHDHAIHETGRNVWNGPIEYLILDRNGKPPRPYERWPKDTVLLGENEVIRVVMKWEHFRGVYAFHCHNIEHDHYMMTQFQVV